MRYFCCLKLSQGLACMLILCYALSTTELRGRFFDDGVRELLLDRGLSCDIFIFYKPTQPNPKTQQQHQEKIPGMSNLESKEDASAGAKDGDNGSGRILAVFDASKVNKEENNSTTEMRLRAFLMFEWKKYTGKLVEDPTNETTGGTTPDSDGKFVQLEKDDATTSNASPSAGDEPIFPSGTQTYKISKFESVQPRDAMQVPDPFKKVSSRLCFFTAITIVQLLMLILHSCCKPGDDSKYSPCELLLTGFCFVIWVLAFCLAAEISYHWNSLWECTNFRPEKPPVFVLTAVLAMLIAILFLAELLAEEDLLAGGTTSAQMPVARRPEANNANSNNNNNQQPPKSNTNHVVAIPRHVHVYSPNNHQQQMVPSERKEFYTIAVRN